MPSDAERNLEEWLNQSFHHLDAGNQLADFSAPQIPCYHFRMSVELILKTLNIGVHNLALGYFDAHPTHSIYRLWEDCRAEFNEVEEAELLENSVRIFAFHHTDYIYVKYRSGVLQTPFGRFSREDIVKHRTAAQNVCEVVKRHIVKIVK